MSGWYGTGGGGGGGGGGGVISAKISVFGGEDEYSFCNLSYGTSFKFTWI